MLRLFTFFFAILIFNQGEAVTTTSKLNWLTNYEDASIKAKREKKAILLFFTGSDWCGWCHKLENEALETTDFSDAVGDQFVFVVVDFPLKTSLDQSTTAQNKDLQKRYDVKGFPTVVLLDENGQLIGTTGYKPGGGKAYADHLKKMAEQFKSYKQKVSKLSPSNTDAKELESLYGKAIELCRKDDIDRIVKLGMQQKNNSFFMLARYRQLADEGEIHSPESEKIRETLLVEEPSFAYELALLEFESLSREVNDSHYAPEIAAAPLLKYIEGFSDADHIWQLDMIIAQVFLEKERIKEALKHAKAAHALSE